MHLFAQKFSRKTTVLCDAQGFVVYVVQSSSFVTSTVVTLKKKLSIGSIRLDASPEAKILVTSSTDPIENETRTQQIGDNDQPYLDADLKAYRLYVDMQRQPFESFARIVLPLFSFSPPKLWLGPDGDGLIR